MYVHNEDISGQDTLEMWSVAGNRKNKLSRTLDNRAVLQFRFN
jgi:hypothetical protein